MAYGLREWKAEQRKQELLRIQERERIARLVEQDWQRLRKKNTAFDPSKRSSTPKGDLFRLDLPIAVEKALKSSGIYTITEAKRISKYEWNKIMEEAPGVGYKKNRIALALLNRSLRPLGGS